MGLGNGEISEWLGPFNSGETVEEKYKWNEKGSYEIKVKSKDEQGAETGWSDPLTISISFTRSYSRHHTNFRLFNILHVFFHEFF